MNTAAPDGGIGQAVEALSATCPSRGDFCGGDAITGDGRTLYTCGAVGAVPTVKRVCADRCFTAAMGSNDVCVVPLVAKSGDLMVLLGGNIDSQNNLLWWADSGSISGGNRFSATYKRSVSTGANTAAGLYRAITGTRVDDPTGAFPGQCVSFVKSTGSSTVATANWRPGRPAKSTPNGTAVARFVSGGYPSTGGHVGFKLAVFADGSLQLGDENYVAPLAVGRHTLKVTNTGGTSDANAYREVLVPQP